MAADTAVKRLEAFSALPAPARQKPARVDRSEYSDRLTRKIARADGPGPAESSEKAAKPQPSVETPDDRAASTSPRSPEPAGREDKLRAGDDSSTGQPTAGSPADSPPADALPGRSASLGEAREAGVVSLEEVAEAVLVDLPGSALPPVVIESGIDARPPWYSPPESESSKSAVISPSASRDGAQIPPAVAALLVGSPATEDPVEEPSTEDEIDVLVPAGFAESVLPSQSDLLSPVSSAVQEPPAATALKDTVAVPVVVEASAFAEPEAALATAPQDVSVSSPERPPVDRLPAAPVIDATSLWQSDEPAEPHTAVTADAVFEATPLSSGEPVEEATPAAQAPASVVPETDTERPAPSAPVEIKADSSALGAVVERDGGEALPPSGASIETASVASSDQPVETATSGEAASQPAADVEPAEPGPSAAQNRTAEIGKAPRAETSAASLRGEASGDALIGHAASALRAAEGLDRPIRIRLTPPELGALRVEISRQDGRVSAQFEVSTPAAQSVLNDHLSTLRESLGRAGVVLDRIEVRLAEPSREEGRSDERRDSQGQNQQEPRDQGRRREGRQERTRSGEPDEGSNETAAPHAAFTARPAPARRHAEADAIDIQA